MTTVHILGIPMDLGQQRRGVDMGPSAIRYAGLQAQIEALGLAVVDHGNLIVPNPEESVATAGDNRLQAVTQICTQVFEWGKEEAKAGSNDISIFLGGDHSISIGSVKAAVKSADRHGNHEHTAQTGIIWIDAHADFNTPETSPSGNIHGMPVAVVTGEGYDSLVNIGNQITVPQTDIVQIGIRDVDPKEADRVRASDLHVYTMSEIDSRGVAAIATETLATLSHCDHIHVSLDLDSLDPSQAPGVGTPVRGGLSYREAHLLAEILGASGLVRTLDVVEVNPILDEKNLTAELAVELIASLLGKKIV